MKTIQLLAFHGDKKIKAKYLSRVRAHRKADEIINGQYWENGKGCAVGCTLHSADHGAYETELGIPRILARLEDRLFEGMFSRSPEVAKLWPERFLGAARIGADLSVVWPKFAHWLLVDPQDGVIKFAKRERSIKAIQTVAALYLRWINGDKPDTKEWAYAASAAFAAFAAYDAYDASDAYAAFAAYDAYDASDAYAAFAAFAASDAYAAARKKHYLRMADKLIELIEACK